MTRYTVTLTDNQGIVLEQWPVETDNDAVSKQDESPNWYLNPLYFADEFGTHIKHSLDQEEARQHAQGLL